MAKTREIKGRIKAVGNIQRITKTMQMIATARFQAASKRATASRPYSDAIARLVEELAAATQGADGADHPLLHAPAEKVNRHLLLLLTSNRGLCGAYNANVMRHALSAYRELVGEGRDIVVEVVGKKGHSTMRYHGHDVDAYLDHFGDRPEYADVEALAERYMKQFTEGRFDSVQVVSMAFQTMSRQEPRTMQLLPMEPPKAEAGAAPSVEYDYSPDPQQLLSELLPITVKVRLFQAFNEAMLSEQVARMVAMKAATDAAQKASKLLTRQYNRARQTAITTELNEIVSGAAVLG